MSLSDTAEYWWDVKRKSTYTGRHMIHIQQSKCGHFNPERGNGCFSIWLNDITCPACLKLIEENGNKYKLLEGTSPSERSEIDKQKHRFRFGTCICGNPMRERTNSVTHKKFLGCSNYPICKQTKPII